MGQPLYRSLGFVAEQPIERWARSACLASSSESTCSRDLSPLAQIIDRAVFGVDRIFLLRSLLQQSQCYSMTGSYLLTRAGRKASYLGPWVGRSAYSARQLLEAALRTPSANGWYWDILPANRGPIALAKEFGFTPQRRLLRMFRGEPMSGREEYIYGIA